MSSRPTDRPYAAGRWARIIAILRAAPATVEEITLALHDLGDLRATRHQTNANLWWLKRRGRVVKTDHYVEVRSAAGVWKHALWAAVEGAPMPKAHTRRRSPDAPTHEAP